MNKPFIYITNWKLNVSYAQAQEFLTIQDNLVHTNKQIIVCPTFPLLPIMQQQLAEQIQLGAQNCSNFTKGSYTGEVDAQTLNAVGCAYCIVGHSERRTLFGETDEMITQKVALLIKNNITPIVCVGEQHKSTTVQTQEYLAQQLNKLNLDSYKQNSLIIAYEPSWAIGGGKLPDITDITTIIEWLQNYCADNQLIHTKIVYGGSVDEGNIVALKQIASLDGVIIGSASADFQKLINIVSL